MEAAQLQYRFILEQTPDNPIALAGLARVEEILNREPSPQPTASPSPEPSATPSPSPAPTIPPVAAPAPPSQVQPDVSTPPISESVPFPEVLSAWPPALLFAAGGAGGAGAVLLIFLSGRLLRGKRHSKSVLETLPAETLSREPEPESKSGFTRPSLSWRKSNPFPCLIRRSKKPRQSSFLQLILKSNHQHQPWKRRLPKWKSHPHPERTGSTGNR